MLCNIYQTVRHVGLSKKDIKSIFALALKYLNKADGEVSLHLVGDERMRSINRKYRNLDKTTDVLAFAIQADQFGNDFFPVGKQTKNKKVFDFHDLGDIFMSIPQIKRQAKKQKISYQQEFTRMLVHGLLHLNGYDHETKAQEKKMFGLQEKLVNKLASSL